MNVCHATDENRMRAPTGGARVRAFSLIEILVVAGLLSVIILGLVAMFGQTQRAFRTGLAQTDVLESGRLVSDLLRRELVLVTPSGLPNVANFYAEIPPPFVYQPLLQDLPGGEQRTNVLMDLFFLTRENRRWNAVGYRVGSPDAGGGVLYRYAATNLAPEELRAQLLAFLKAPLTNLNRVADGVVHFRVRAFDTNGVWIREDLPNDPNHIRSDIRLSGVVPGEVGLYVFKSNAIPAAVEVELGVVERRTWERAASIPDPAARREFLTQQAGRTHLFRQWVKLPLVDPSAYWDWETR